MPLTWRAASELQGASAAQHQTCSRNSIHQALKIDGMISRPPGLGNRLSSAAKLWLGIHAMTGIKLTTDEKAQNMPAKTVPYAHSEHQPKAPGLCGCRQATVGPQHGASRAVAMRMDLQRVSHILLAFNLLVVGLADSHHDGGCRQEWPLRLPEHLHTNRRHQQLHERSMQAEDSAERTAGALPAWQQLPGMLLQSSTGHAAKGSCC